MARDRFESDDEQALRDSIDILKEEQDREELISGPSSAFSNVFARTDPNNPRKMTRKDMRRQRRRDQRAKRRRKGDTGELLYEMEEGKRSDSSRSSSLSRSSTELFLQQSTTRPRRRTRKGRCLRLFLLPLLASAVFVLLVWGAIRASSSPKVISPAAKKPKTVLSNGTSNFAPTTVLISLDGFRADFLDRGLTPMLNSLVAEGVSPEYMLPSFPSLTFPNHWTLVTGLHPESHGIVGNTFWDPKLGEEFYYTDPLRSMQPKWWTSTGAEPLWSACERQGVRTAVHMWPGSEAGMLPEPLTIDKYNGKEDLTKKANRVLSFLDRPSEFDNVKVSTSDARPQFIAMYVPNVDSDGHKFGPNSTEIRTTIGQVDTMLGDMLAGIKARNLTSIVNVVVVSDHGMATTSTSRMIQLDDLVNPVIIDHTDGWPLYGLRPKPDIDVNRLYNLLVTNCKGKHVTPYLKENMPERWHFSKSDRIAPLWLIPDPGYAIVPKSEFNIAASIQANIPYHPAGLHGYDNENPLMRAIFVARGPAFPHAPNSKVEPFQNIEVYNLIADSLEIDIVKNNGTLRLPLKTIGLHDGVKEASQDLPPYEQPSKSQQGAEKDSSSGKPSEEQGKQPEHPKGWKEKVSSGINKLKDKINNLKDWFKGLIDNYHW